MVGVGGGLAGVGVRPVGGEDAGGGVGSVVEPVVGAVGFAGFDGADFAVDADEGVAEPVELAAVFGFGGLDHEGAGDGPGHGGSVVTIVHETLGDVLDADARNVLEGAEVEDAFVGDEAAAAFVEHGEEGGEAVGDVVGVEDGPLGGEGQAGGSHHADIHPGNGEDAGAAPGGGADPAGVAAAGEEGGEVHRDADGPDAWPASAVGDAEGFVGIEVADIGSDESTARG